MQIESAEERDGRSEYVVDLEDGRKAFLTVRKDSHPLRVESGSATGNTVATSSDQMATVDEAGRWLVAEIAAGRA